MRSKDRKPPDAPEPQMVDNSSTRVLLIVQASTGHLQVYRTNGSTQQAMMMLSQAAATIGLEAIKESIECGSI